MCPRDHLAHCKKYFWFILCHKKNRATLLHLCYFCHLLLVTNYLPIKLFVITIYNTCRKPRANSFCSSLGSTLLLIERTTIDPLHLWVIIAIEDKKVGFISYCLSLSLYIMSSYLMRYFILMNLIHKMHAG